MVGAQSYPVSAEDVNVILATAIPLSARIVALADVVDIFFEIYEIIRAIRGKWD